MNDRATFARIISRDVCRAIIRIADHHPDNSKKRRSRVVWDAKKRVRDAGRDAGRDFELEITARSAARAPSTHRLGEGDPAAAKNQLTGGGERRYGRGVTHPLLDRLIVRAVERAATEHLGRAWACVGFTDLNHRASHPCGIFTGMPFSVFAKLDASPAGADQFTAELNGFGLIRSRARVATPVPIAGGLVATSAGTLLLSEALPERGTATGRRPMPARRRTTRRSGAPWPGCTRRGARRSAWRSSTRRARQSNRPADPGRWADFSAERRLRRMLRCAVDSGNLPDELARGADRVTACLPSRRPVRSAVAKITARSGSPKRHRFASPRPNRKSQNPAARPRAVGYRCPRDPRQVRDHG